MDAKKEIAPMNESAFASYDRRNHKVAGPTANKLRIDTNKGL
jgi:hypothetical protein